VTKITFNFETSPNTKPKEKKVGDVAYYIPLMEKWGTLSPCPPPNCTHASTSSWTARPDGSGRWDNWMAAQNLPRDLVRSSSGWRNSVAITPCDSMVLKNVNVVEWRQATARMTARKRVTHTLWRRETPEGYPTKLWRLRHVSEALVSLMEDCRELETGKQTTIQNASTATGIRVGFHQASTSSPRSNDVLGGSRNQSCRADWEALTKL